MTAMTLLTLLSLPSAAALTAWAIGYTVQTIYPRRAQGPALNNPVEEYITCVSLSQSN